ncbi:hypothetical protein C0991_011245 [Blastosporella zonata]|nr:hypothetical protein C0991_011245 [Blastosporella zonata]
MYERQSKKNGTTNFYETVGAVAEKVFETLPRQLKRMAFFEGLAGSDADISAIFEIEEDYESALDTNDEASYLGHERPRRVSSGSVQRNPPPRSPTTGYPMPRTRLNSIMYRGSEAAQSFVSPLAQVFQPLVVDEPIPEEPTDKAEGGSGVTPPVPVPSYGSATRRRLSSVHVMRGHQQPSPPLLQQIQARKFPTLSKSASPPRSALFMRSPEPQSSSRPETASEAIEESRVEHSGGRGVEQRLEDMEKTQKRIEEVLMEIARDIRH